MSKYTYDLLEQYIILVQEYLIFTDNKIKYSCSNLLQVCFYAIRIIQRNK